MAQEQPATARRASPTGGQARFMAKAARLYYEQGMSQAEVAKALHVSQPRVSRTLKRAVEAGVVRISVVAPPGVHAEAEAGLEAKYGLKEAVVVDSTEDGPALVRGLGTGAALFLEDTLTQGEVVGLSSWSANLLATADALRPLQSKSVAEVIQLLGGVGDPQVQMRANHLLTTFADKTGGAPVFLPAPGLLGSGAIRNSLMADATIAQVSAMWPKVTTALMGIGGLEPSPILRASGNGVGLADQQVLRQRGAVGDVCLRFFDDQGQAVRSHLDSRIVGIDPQQLAAIPRRVGVAGGSRKHQAIRAALLGRWVNILVTDVKTAAWLLA
jgi:DNA-binding transcriptional regulator LsrR (DeoR family)